LARLCRKASWLVLWR